MTHPDQPFDAAILAVVREALRSSRWDNPDHPGSARIKELSEYVCDGSSYSEFRKTDVGSYFLEIIEPLQLAFNDDWLPHQLFGLKLPVAKEFLAYVSDQVADCGLSKAIPNLRAKYSALSHES